MDKGLADVVKTPSQM